jgi:hypothetical protein
MNQKYEDCDPCIATNRAASNMSGAEVKGTRSPEHEVVLGP